jgi:hypothetical protein
MTTSNRRARLVLWEHVAAIGAYAHADAAARAAPAGSVTASDAEAARQRAHERVLAAVNALHDLPDGFRRVLEQPFRGIVFNLFGTLVERKVERHPFRQMIAWAFCMPASHRRWYAGRMELSLVPAGTRHREG